MGLFFKPICKEWNIIMVADNPYGVSRFCANQSDIVTTQSITDMQNLGVSWLRFQPGGYVLETASGTPPTYSWAVMDDAVSKCNAAGIHITHSVHGAPAWGLQSTSCGGGTYIADPNWVQQHATALATRYNGQNGYGYLDCIEIGNEDYSQATLACRTYNNWTPAVLQAAPAIRAAGFVGKIGACALLTNNSSFLNTWFNGVYASDAAQYVDYFNFHFYRGGGISPPDMAPDNHSIDNFWTCIYNALVANGDPNKAIWMTETGYATFTGSSAAAADVVSQQQQSDYFMQTLDSVRRSGVVAKAFVYCMDQLSANNDPKSITQGYSPTVYLPAYYTYQNYIGQHPQWPGKSSSGLQSGVNASNFTSGLGTTAIASSTVGSGLKYFNQLSGAS